MRPLALMPDELAWGGSFFDLCGIKQARVSVLLKDTGRDVFYNGQR